MMKMNNNSFLAYMLLCLVSTIIIELIISLILGVRNKKDIVNIILVNALTNPLVVSITNLANLFIGYNESYIVLYILEVLAIICEGFIYHKYLKFKKINAYVLSIIFNVSSYLIGLLIL